MLKVLVALFIAIVAAFTIDGAFARETETSSVAGVPATPPNESKTADLAKPNANHNLLGELAGAWNYVLKISMGPNKSPVETNGFVVRMHDKLFEVTASQIIEEIKRLNPKEQLDVIRFA